MNYIEYIAPSSYGPEGSPDGLGRITIDGEFYSLLISQPIISGNPGYRKLILPEVNGITSNIVFRDSDEYQGIGTGSQQWQLEITGEVPIGDKVYTGEMVGFVGDRIACVGRQGGKKGDVAADPIETIQQGINILNAALESCVILE